MKNRYAANGPEAEFEPGSRGRVLRNLLGIRRVRDMQLAESQALVLAQDAVLDRYGPEHRFTAQDLCDMHALWLEDIYPWAGKYRSVNIGKGGFQFAHAPLVPGLMRSLEAGPLARHTPLTGGDEIALAQALAEVHAELILIHPFREGNGRLSRMLAVVMAMQAGLPALDFRPLLGHGKVAYIVGIHAALGRDYQSLTAVFSRVIAGARRRAGASRP